jgi:nucleoside-diphosphate-sugar epimerase
MNCLLVGGAGFIGAYVVEALLKEGHKPVVWDASLAENTIHKLLSPEELSKVAMVAGDVTDLAQLIHIIQEFEIDSIVHLASWQIPGSHNNPTKAILVNGEGFNNTLEAVASLGIRRLVWTSSNAVFGSPNSHQVKRLPNDEFHRPNTVYGALKSLNEYMAEHFFQHRGVDSIGFRFSLVYGYGRMRGASAFASEMIEKAALGLECVINMGDSCVDWFYVVDAAHLIIQALKAPTTQTRVFNTHSCLHTVQEAADYLSRNLPEAKLTVNPGTINANWDLDPSLLIEELGYKPRYSLEEGLRDAVSLVRKKASLPELPGFSPVQHYATSG